MQSRHNLRKRLSPEGKVITVSRPELSRTGAAPEWTSRLETPSSIRQYSARSVYPNSAMSTLYRGTLLKLLADQARAELAASHAYAAWIPRAPGPEEKMYLAQLAKEETEHWYRAIKLLEVLGVHHLDVSRHQSHNWFYLLSRLSIGWMRWVDVLMMSFLIDHAAFFLVEDFSQSSYAPWAQMAAEILEEEQGHPEMGIHYLRRLIRERGPQCVQNYLHKWWRVALNMFGPPITKNTELYIRLGLKFRSNEQRRQAYRQSCEPKIRELGLDIPKLRHPSYPFF